MSEPHTLHPAALPMVTIQMREPACSNLDPEVTRLLNNHHWCLESNEYAQMQPLSVRNQDQSCLCRYLGPVSRITTAAIDIKLSLPIWHRLFLPTQPVFSVTSTTSPRCLYAAGSTTAGPGWDWGTHLWCSPGTLNTSMTASHKMQFFRFLQTVTNMQQCNKSKSNYSCLLCQIYYKRDMEISSHTHTHT